MKKMTIRTAITAGLLLLSAEGYANEDQWRYGLATGIFGLNVEGDVGLGTKAGPLLMEDADIDFDDILDLSETSGGLAGFATKGPWRIDFSAAVLELNVDEGGVVTSSNIPVSLDVTYKASAVNAGVSYRFNKSGGNLWNAYGGLRYTKHEIESEIIVGPATANRDIENDWVDIYLGLQYTRILTPEFLLSTKVDVGGGGSDLSTTFNTSLVWLIDKNWTSSFYGQYYTVDFENDDIGDEDWYLYDTAEFGLGIGIAYTF